MSLINISIIPLARWGLGLLEVKTFNSSARALFFISYNQEFGVQFSILFLGQYMR